VNTFATTLQEVLTAIAEQDSNLKLIKWAVKVNEDVYNSVNIYLRRFK